MLDAFPKIRDEIDVVPASRDGETYYILYDRAGVAPSRLLVSPLGLLVAGRLDGSASVLDISDRLSREYGGTPCQEVEKIVHALDEALFLDGRRFHDYQSQAARDFRSAPVRPAGSAGSAYDDNPERLAAELDRMIDEAPPAEEPAGFANPRPRGVVVPHIDYMRGAPGYGQLYRRLAASPKPGTAVVIGTAHMPLAWRFSLCEKDFATPFGPVRLDRELAGRLRKAMGDSPDPDGDLLAHRGEHSIELQAVWLRHLYGPDIRIVPVLAASLGEFIEGGREPEEAPSDPVLRAVADCLAEAVAGGETLLVASADLAHVGPRFGDAEEVTNQYLAEVEAADRDYLSAVARGAVAGLKSLAAHGDRHHVCGSACIFTLGLALPGASARLLGYHQAATPESGQAVTYAAMTLA